MKLKTLAAYVAVASIAGIIAIAAAGPTIVAQKVPEFASAKLVRTVDDRRRVYEERRQRFETSRAVH